MALGDLLRIDQRPAQPFAQGPAARGGDGAVEHGEQGAAPPSRAGDGGALAGEDLQIGERRGVEDQAVAGLAHGQSADVGEAALLGLLGVGERRRSRLHRRLPLLQSETAQGAGAELAQQQLARALGLEQAVAGERRPAGALALGPLDDLHREPLLAALGVEQHLARPQQGEVLHRLLGSAPAADEEGSGREVEERPRPRLALPDQPGEEVLLLPLQQPGIGDRAGGDHPGHVALDQPLGLGRVLDLIADRHLEPDGEELAEIALQRVMGHPAHRHLALRPLVAGGELHLQDRRRLAGVFEEHLVEVAHAVHQQGIGIPRLDLQVLAHHGRQGRDRRERGHAGRSITLRKDGTSQDDVSGARMRLHEERWPVSQRR